MRLARMAMREDWECCSLGHMDDSQQEGFHILFI
ncbi:rCG59566 [Rattus norvegicus]|uniref:RCG59566 n=1 Tax=Rattus norvegicus TaxID=10116 RepID=A6HSX6_RAT|nr:rCG59566 [Rattus norvegicus]